MQNQLAVPFARRKSPLRWPLRILGGLTAMIVLYGVLGHWLVPWLIVKYLPDYATRKTGHRFELAALRFQPFRLLLDIEKLGAQNAAGEPVLSVQHLHADLDGLQLLQGVIRLVHVRIEQPAMTLVVEADGQTNLARLVAAFGAGAKPDQPDSKPTRIVLDRLTLRQGAFRYADRRLSDQPSLEATDLDLSLTNVQTASDQRGGYTLQAGLPGGGTLALDGDLTISPLHVTGKLRIDGLKPDAFWPLLRERLALEAPAGMVHVATGYTLAVEPAGTQFRLEALDLGIAGIKLAHANDATPLLDLAQIAIAGANLDLAQRKLTIRRLTLARGKIGVHTQPNGQPYWASLVKTSSTAPPAARPAAPESKAPKPAVPASGTPVEGGPKAWDIRLESLELAGVAVEYRNDHAPQPVAVDTGAASLKLGVTALAGSGPTMVKLEPLILDLPSLAVRLGAREAPKLTLASAATHLALTASVRSGTDLNVALDHASLELADVGFTQQGTKPVAVRTGSLQLGLTAALHKTADGQAVQLNDLGIHLAQVSLQDPASGKPVLALDRIAAGGGRVDTGQRTVEFEDLQMHGGNLEIVREANGRLSPAALFGDGSKATALRRTAGAEPIQTPNPSAAWRVALNRSSLDGFRLRLTDRAVRGIVQYDLDPIVLTVERLRTDSDQPLPFHLQAKVKQGGVLKLRGHALPTGAKVDAELDIDRFNLEPLAPLVGTYAFLDLRKGAFSTALKVEFRQDQAGPKLDAAGTAQVHDLLLRETATNDRLFSIDTLKLDGIAYSLDPPKLQIDEARLSGPGAKIVIAADRTVNLAKLARAEARPKPAAQTRPAKRPKPPLVVSVDRVRVEDGTVDFADLSLVLPFAARIEQFVGNINGISTAPKTQPTLAFTGRVGEYGQADVYGSLDLQDSKRYTDVKVLFRNVEMPPLSPYSATFAGRRIARGKLNLELKYDIQDGRLQGENQIVLQDFTLGKRVESPRALKLPLDLAISLLTDSRGRIDVSVPVRGEVGKPEFSYGGLIRKALADLITGVVRAPFRWLAGTFGKGIEEAGNIEFPYGSTDLLPPEREKLARVAAVLTEKDQLKLTVAGGYAAAEDARALAERDLRLALAERQGVRLAPGEDPGPPALDNPKTQRALEKVAEDRGGDAIPTKVVAAYGKKTGREAERVNPVLALLGRGAGDRGLYQALYEHLIETGLPGEQRLEALANARADAILDYLTKMGRVPAQRIGRAEAQSREPEERAVPSKLSLGMR